MKCTATTIKKSSLKIILYPRTNSSITTSPLQHLHTPSEQVIQSYLLTTISQNPLANTAKTPTYTLIMAANSTITDTMADLVNATNT